MDILINQINEMLEEIGCSELPSEYERGYREGLRVAVHMIELYNKLNKDKG